MAEDWEPWLDRWESRGLLSPEIVSNIRAFESSQTKEHRLRWPVLLALGCGGAALSAGVLLFVSAHWDNLSPSARMIVVLVMLMMFHAGGAFASKRFPALAISLHAIGTAVLGAAIALTGQIFNLDAHWPAAILLWAMGGVLGWWLLEHWTQAIFVAILAPAWLALEWWYFAGENEAAAAPALVFVFIISTVYLGGRLIEGSSPLRQALTWIGATTILPLGIALSFSSRSHIVVSPWATAAAWVVAVTVPLVVAHFLRVSLAWTVAATLWAIGIARVVHGGIGGYAWDAAGAIALAVWGMREGRLERVNLGIAGFALTVAIFYFSSVMDKLGRSASLVGLGVLLLGGGWGLERLRRLMIERTRAAIS